MLRNKDLKVTSRNLFKHITKEKSDVGNIYIYALFAGLVQLSIPLGIQAIVNYAMGATMVTSLYLLIAFVVIGTWLTGYFRLKVMQIIEKIEQKIFVEYSIAFAEKLPKVNLQNIKKYFLPELVNRFFDTQNLQKAVSKILLDIPTALIQIVLGLILLAFYHPWFLVFGALVIIIVIIIFRQTMHSGIQSSLEESESKYEVASWLEDIAGAVKTFKINSGTDLHLGGTDQRVGDYLENRTSHFKVLILQYKAIIGFKVIITFFLLSIGTYLLVTQQLNIGAFIATEIVLLTIMAAVEKLIINLESYYDVVTSLTKLGKVLDLDEEPNAQLAPSHKNGQGMQIDLVDVNFSFVDNKPILKEITTRIESNSMTVISGYLGAGKTILLNLIAGFYEPTSGNILFDRVAIRNMDKTVLREQIGVYLEDMPLIKATVFENIQLGRADVKRADVLELTEKLGIENFSSRFTKDLDTKIRETDTEVSFSTKKKILLLRALLGSNRLLILEDPIEGMDRDFSEKFVDYLRQIKKYTTVVIVSENEKLIHEADQHLMLEYGKIVTYR
ncbi:peptidase domain-containing ABC transporter [Sphingobacterium gobiense]|uniref:ABC transporter ATP-binding protein n=1 Tax=Sphingobacterium gobiense TaxID=1382456 RepID=A0A2S9JNT5_9SPHI|nr:ABC transporter ATP-binding protein [Sphingobacterium gobiense]PRD54649.1 ABC transporter ATP-binding protein [Sphingobacterium gobiense]